jgi:hypothetical protein
MQSLFLEKQLELGPDDVGADVRRDAEIAAERIRFALGPPKSACRYSMPADQSDASIHSKPAPSRGFVRS